MLKTIEIYVEYELDICGRLLIITFWKSVMASENDGILLLKLRPNGIVMGKKWVIGISIQNSGIRHVNAHHGFFVWHLAFSAINISFPEADSKIWRIFFPPTRRRKRRDPSEVRHGIEITTHSPCRVASSTFPVKISAAKNQNSSSANWIFLMSWFPDSDRQEMDEGTETNCDMSVRCKK